MHIFYDVRRYLYVLQSCTALQETLVWGPLTRNGERASFTQLRNYGRCRSKAPHVLVRNAIAVGRTPPAVGGVTVTPALVTLVAAEGESLAVAA